MNQNIDTKKTRLSNLSISGNRVSRYISKFFLKSSYGKPVMFLIIFTIICTIITPKFLSFANMKAVLISASPLMIIAVGEALVILTGMIDLGVESIAASTGVLIAFLNIIMGVFTGVCIIVALLYGLLIGLLVGILVTKTRIPSFVTTLGIYWGLRGVGMLLGGGLPISPSSVVPARPIGFSWIAGYFGKVPIMPLIAISIVLVFHFYVCQSQRGVHIYATGGDEIAAKNRGVKTDRVKIFVFVMSGMLAATAGIMMTAWLNSGYAWSAQGYSMQAIAAVVLGGIPFTGGYGTIIGVGIGAIIIAMISDIITLVGISPLYNYIVTAVIMVIAGSQIKKSGEVVK
ncbi:ABC transporter permease [Candidatus Aerophobetes bacterium]|nr:ABC transporter permease [Candidatus Aerophobetes bacterium]